MAVTDPIADALTKIRNASRVQHPTVEVKPSKLMERILEVLKNEGYIRTYQAVGETVPQRRIRVYLKYAKKAAAIQHLGRISSPGVRVYRGVAKLPRVRRGLGVAIVSTSKGVMTDRDAYKQGIGGEVLCYVW